MPTKARFNRSPKSPRRGFTLLELTFSIAFYTFIVMTALTAFIGIFGIYNKSQGLSRTQLQARTALDSLVRDLRNTESIVATNTPSLTGPNAGEVVRLFCLQSTNGFVKGYAELWQTGDRIKLIRLQNCFTTEGYEMLIGPDTWLDATVGGKALGILTQDGNELNVPLDITELNNGSKPKVWQVTVAAHKGSRIKTLPGHQDLQDQFSAETTLRTVVTTRK